MENLYEKFVNELRRFKIADRSLSNFIHLYDDHDEIKLISCTEADWYYDLNNNTFMPCTDGYKPIDAPGKNYMKIAKTINGSVVYFNSIPIDTALQEKHTL